MPSCNRVNTSSMSLNFRSKQGCNVQRASGGLLEHVLGRPFTVEISLRRSESCNVLVAADLELGIKVQTV